MDHLEEEHDYLIEEEELQEIRGAFLNDTIAALEPSEPICLNKAATVAEAIARMLERRQAGVLIIDDAGRLAGIFTERDLLNRIVGLSLNDDLAIGEVMTRGPRTLSPDDRIADAIHLMTEQGYRHIPLVDRDAREVGMISARDIVEFIAEHYPKEVFNLPPDPDQVLRRPEGG